MDLLVNATSIGLQPLSAPLFDYGVLRPPLVVMDLVFFPRATPFLKAAQANGCQAINGLGMLLHQAALSFQCWTGRPAPLALMRQAYEEALTRREREA
jgi:shikimate dehydrogenase